MRHRRKAARHVGLCVVRWKGCTLKIVEDVIGGRRAQRADGSPGRNRFRITNTNPTIPISTKPNVPGSGAGVMEAIITSPDRPVTTSELPPSESNSPHPGGSHPSSVKMHHSNPSSALFLSKQKCCPKSGRLGERRLFDVLRGWMVSSVVRFTGRLARVHHLLAGLIHELRYPRLPVARDESHITVG
jgi:hypothetical protein